MKNLTHRNQLERYDNIIQDLIKGGVVEKVDQVCERKIAKGEKMFYLPHRPVIRELAETTKLRIVHDTSAKPTKNSASLNDCLETGPPLPNSMWDVSLNLNLSCYLVILKRPSYRQEYGNARERFCVFIG